MNSSPGQEQSTTEAGYLHQRCDQFGKLPPELMHDKTVTDGAKLLYAHMHWRYGSNHDNHEGRLSMGDFLGVSETTITNRAKELVATDWIVVTPRVDQRGRTSNRYDVFEVQEDCRKWRIEHDTPKPIIEFKPRKLRQGIGGKNSHKQIGGETQVNGGKETQVEQPSELKLSNLVNSSSQDPDSYDPDPVIPISGVAPMEGHPENVIPLNGVLFSLENPFQWIVSSGYGTLAHIAKSENGNALCKESVRFRTKLNPEIGPRQPCEKCQIIYEARPKARAAPATERIDAPLKAAVAKHLQRFEEGEETEYTGILAQTIARVWRKHLHTEKLTADQYAAIARSVPVFVEWYLEESDDSALPNDRKKVEDWYTRFPKNRPSNQEDRNKMVEHPDYRGVKISLQKYNSIMQAKKMAEEHFGGNNVTKQRAG